MEETVKIWLPEAGGMLALSAVKSDKALEVLNSLLLAESYIPAGATAAPKHSSVTMFLGEMSYMDTTTIPLHCPYTGICPRLLPKSLRLCFMPCL